MTESVLLFIFFVLGGSMLAQWTAWRFRLPAIVLLFSLGLVAGPGLEILHPTKMIGPAFHSLVSLAVALIVFEGGLALDFRQLKQSGEGVIRLTLFALPINLILGSAAAHYIGAMSWGAAFLFGAIIVVTGPTVVLPLLRQAKLHPRVAAFLRWEAIINDPVGAILATLVLEVLLMRPGEGSGTFFGFILPHMILSAGLMILLGFGAAWGMRWLWVRDMMPEILKIPVLITSALVLFVLGTLAMDGAGLMASTVFGMALVNLRIPGFAEIQRMKEALVVLIVSILFVLLTADLQRAELAHLSISIGLLTLAVLFLVRPLGILLATIRSDLTWPERIFVGWIAPRGIVAAAVAGIAGLRLQDAGYPGAGQVMPAVFAIIASTMILHGFSLMPLGRRLKLTLSNEPALAIVGANTWSTHLAATLHKANVPVLLVDSSEKKLMRARHEKIPVLQTEVLSEEGAESLEERPADYLICATPDNIYNGLVCAHLAPHFGHQRVFQVSPGIARLDQYSGLSRDARGKVFGDPSWNFTLLETLISEGWHFMELIVTTENKHTVFHENNNLLPFLVIQKGVAISVLSAEDDIRPSLENGYSVIALVPPEFSEAELITGGSHYVGA
ncbi:cation:proton antiporter [Acetobacter thailandicus]|uniref:Cation:proton antiporter n=1 Tax=Acetobacter thailandicus TaxID=1502842 RepID=A0ABT3QG47_9PROT|nr:sodium:proton antiporter [Acetobacter thailandicus]MBS1002836.1 sodium:proton antiporter [Acetobacter thailandicus]MCX2564255.1 cation:proton antiporter [Acetobacter thailandicus]NHN95599.1 sodium:proton antiporter [Acetobacter thailandicus]